MTGGATSKISSCCSTTVYFRWCSLSVWSPARAPLRGTPLGVAVPPVEGGVGGRLRPGRPVLVPRPAPVRAPAPRLAAPAGTALPGVAPAWPEYRDASGRVPWDGGTAPVDWA